MRLFRSPSRACAETRGVSRARSDRRFSAGEWALHVGGLALWALGCGELLGSDDLRFDRRPDDTAFGGASGAAAGADGSAADAGFGGAADTGFGGTVSVGASGSAGSRVGEPCSRSAELGCDGRASTRTLICDGARWALSGICARGDLCDSGSGQCAEIVPECVGKQPRTTFCREDVVHACGVDLVTEEAVEDCEGLCSDGSCLEPSCGDGKVQATNETCDDANEVVTDGCVECREARCGDSYIQDGVEECDGTDTDAGDGCSARCWLEWRPSAGGIHTCAVSAGRLKCWGYNSEGELGLGNANDKGDSASEMGENLPFVDLGMDSEVPFEVSAITAGTTHTCALSARGRVKCWGFNDRGQLGLGDSTLRGRGAMEMGDALPSVDLGMNRLAKAIAAGDNHTCAILDRGEVKCWGSNLFGQLGYGDRLGRGEDPADMGDALEAVRLGTDLEVAELAAGANHTCALFTNGGIKCWGSNSQGQLGFAALAPHGTDPSEMGDNLDFVDLGPEPAIGIAAGYDRSCAVLESRRIKCWGSNSSGELGLGDTEPRGFLDAHMGVNLPHVDLGKDREVFALAVGTEHSCAVLDRGEIRCWGNNFLGQLGLGDDEDRGNEADEMGENLPFVKLGSEARAIDVTAGMGHSCASFDNGRIKCWGINSNGELGVGDDRDRGRDATDMGDDLPWVNLGGLMPSDVVNAP